MASGVEIPTLSAAECLLRLGLAGVLGAAIGFERERRERAAGLRTHVLVSVGAAIFTIISAYGWHGYFSGVHVPNGTSIPAVDPSRVAAQIVSGIGFLGGGVILRSGLNVTGLTTAASLWAMGAVGMAVGSGMYALAAMATACLLFALIVLRRVNDIVHDRFHEDTARLSVRVRADHDTESVLNAVEHHTVAVTSIGIESAGIDTGDEVVTLDVRLIPGVSKLALSQKIARLSGVSEVHLHDLRGSEQ